MERKTIIGLGILTAVMPLLIIVWAHTFWWPEFLAVRTDSFFPPGPKLNFSDFVPSDRTAVARSVENFMVRPITASPVYLLFLPRVHSRTVVVELVARPADGPYLSAEPPIIHLGYRHGANVEGNVLTPVIGSEQTGWLKWRVSFPLAEMTPENGDARRLVFAFEHDNGRVWEIKSVRIFYEK